MSRGPQALYWCFTYNNPACEPKALWHLASQAGASYLVFGEETAPTTGTEHWQGYVEFTNKKRLTQLNAMLAGCHWERRLGTQQQAIDYCKGLSAGKTPNAVVHEFGTPKANEQGKRNDIHDAAATLREEGLVAMAEQHQAALVRYPRGFLLLNSLITRTKPVPTVHLHFGPTGSGKTKRFFDSAPADDLWRLPITDGLWFDGYHGQSYALLDDFDGRASKFPLRLLLQLLDRYPVDVPIKGGFVAWVPREIHITTNFHPRSFYDWSNREQQWPALIRRISWVHWYRLDSPTRSIPNPSLELSEDVDLDTTWDHFWRGPDVAQLELDRASGRLVSHAPPDMYDW